MTYSEWQDSCNLARPYTKSCLATPDLAGRTAVRPYRLAGWESGVWNSDSVLEDEPAK